MLIHIAVTAQSSFTIAACGAILFLMDRANTKERRVRPPYVKYWIFSYLLLSLITGVLIDINRELEYFWVYAIIAISAYTLGNIALWKSLKQMLDR